MATHTTPEIIESDASPTSAATTDPTAENTAAPAVPGHTAANNCGFHPGGAAARDRNIRHHRTTNFSAIRAKAAEDLDSVEALQAEASAAAAKSAEVGNRLAEAVKRAKESHFEFKRATESMRDAGNDVDDDSHLKRAAKLIG
ncbi:MAG TPA: hypothetical protein VM008_09715 [Phycisphaerae bacterium]|nr:hypothetical protein [Phycisphaerae bacterium]